MLRALGVGTGNSMKQSCFGIVLALLSACDASTAPRPFTSMDAAVPSDATPGPSSDGVGQTEEDAAGGVNSDAAPPHDPDPDPPSTTEADAGADPEPTDGPPDSTDARDGASDVASAGETPAPAPPPLSGMAAREDFFRSEVVHRIEVTVDPSVWESFMREHQVFDPHAQRTWYQANFRIDGVELRNVGFHSFGWGSRAENQAKPNLSLDTDRVVPGQSLRGIERMRIKNNGQDVSGLRQAILYQAMRASNLMAPRSTYADLFVNDQPYGFYFVEESFTQGFIRERTGNSDGAAYEPAGCQGFVMPSQGGCEAMVDYFNDTFNPNPAGAAHLIGLCRAMNGPAEGWIEAVAPYIDLHEWIDQVAIDTALAGNNDGFSVAGANFRLYHDTALNKLRLVILGNDDTFDADWLPNPSFLRPEPSIDCRSERSHYRDIFIEKLVATPAGLALYQAAVRELRTGALAAQTVKQRVDALWAIVGDRARNDPLREPSQDLESSKEAIKRYVDLRWKILEDAGF
jgi:hypothetical protein